MENRILTAIQKRKEDIARKLSSGEVTQEKLKSLHKKLDMDVMEFCKFQNIKSLAMLKGKLSQDEAQTVYNLLGENYFTFNNQPIEVKAVLTRLFGELLEMR